MKYITRRQILTAAAVGVVPLAGCQDTGDGGGSGASLRIISFGRDDFSDSVRVSGTVKNEGSETAEQAAVEATFYGSDGDVVGSDSVPLGTLEPSQTAQFTIEYESAPETLDDYTVKPVVG
jgi:hypothetical protein